MANPKLFRQAAEDVHNEKKQEDNAPEEKPDAPVTAPKAQGGTENPTTESKEDGDQPENKEGDDQTENKDGGDQSESKEGDQSENKEGSDQSQNNEGSDQSANNSAPKKKKKRRISLHRRLKKKYVDNYKKSADKGDDKKDAEEAAKEKKSENTTGGENANTANAGGENTPAADGAAAPAAEGAAAPAAEGGDKKTFKEFMNSDGLGNAMTITDALADGASFGGAAADMKQAIEQKKSGENPFSDENKDKRKAGGITSLVGNAANTATGAVNTYRDIQGAMDDKKKGKVGAADANFFNVAGDITGTAGSLLGTVNSITDNDTVGLIGDAAGFAGSGFSTVGAGLQYSQQKKSMKAMDKYETKAAEEGATKDDKRRKKAANMYKKQTSAKQNETRYGIGSGIVDMISGGLSIASDILGDGFLSMAFSMLTPLLGLLSKGLGLIGSKKADSAAGANHAEIVNNYIANKVTKIEQESKDNNDNLSKEQMENIAIARLGVPVDNIAGGSVKDGKQQDIFNAICKRRAKVLMQDNMKEIVSEMGIDPKNPNREEAILEALGYEE